MKMNRDEQWAFVSMVFVLGKSGSEEFLQEFSDDPDDAIRKLNTAWDAWPDECEE